MPRWDQAGLGAWSWGSQLGPEGEGSTSVMLRVLQTPRKRKTRHSSNPPMECHVGWVMDSREHRPRTASIRYPGQACRIVEEAEMGKGGEGVWEGRGKQHPGIKPPLPGKTWGKSVALESSKMCLD